MADEVRASLLPRPPHLRLHSEPFRLACEAAVSNVSSALAVAAGEQVHRIGEVHARSMQGEGEGLSRLVRSGLSVAARTVDVLGLSLNREGLPRGGGAGCKVQGRIARDAPCER